MLIGSLVPFLAIVFFLLALVFRKKELSALGWIAAAGYSIRETAHYVAIEEYFDASLALILLVFSLLLTYIMLKPAPKEKEDVLFTITKVAFITALFYFPFTEIPLLGDALIYLTTSITTAVLNYFNIPVYMVPPSHIFTTDSSFHAVHKPIEIILACTAIQSIVLFIGLIFGVTAPLGRKLKALMVSVPVIYVLNILRDVFVVAAYFEQWFGAPLDSFFIAHNVLARIVVLISLILIAYAVFEILPETLDFLEEFFTTIKSVFPGMRPIESG
jgi:archaeosortase A (PGF-CTERM-specific)